MIPNIAGSSFEKEKNIQVFRGTLVEGTIYQAIWPIDDIVLENLPHHHAFNIEWRNKRDYPALKKSDKFIFKVISKKTYKVDGQYRWNDEIVCEIIDC